MPPPYLQRYQIGILLKYGSLRGTVTWNKNILPDGKQRSRARKTKPIHHPKS